jgi:hypothetical protein
MDIPSLTKTKIIKIQIAFLIFLSTELKSKLNKDLWV